MKERKSNFFRNVGLTLLGVASIFTFANSVKYKFKYDISPNIERRVEEGDSLNCYARFEGIESKREIARYVEAMRRMNNYYISGIKKAVGDNGRIK